MTHGRGDGRPDRLGHPRRPDRRARRAADRPGRHRGRRGARDDGPGLGRPGRTALPRRRVRGQLQLGERPRRRRLVPAGTSRSGDGHPADGAAARRGDRRGHDGRHRRPGRHLRCPVDPGGRRRPRAACSPPCLVIDPPRPEATPRADRQPLPATTASSGASTASRCCWSSRSSWCGPTRWSGWCRSGTGRRPRPVPWSRSPTCSAPFGRIGVGALSDAVGSRVRPLRWVAIAAALTMLLLGLTEPLPVAVVAAGDRLDRDRRRQRPGLHQRRRAGRRRSGRAGPSACRTPPSTSPPRPSPRSPRWPSPSGGTPPPSSSPPPSRWSRARWSHDRTHPPARDRCPRRSLFATASEGLPMPSSAHTPPPSTGPAAPSTCRSSTGRRRGCVRRRARRHGRRPLRRVRGAGLRPRRRLPEDLRHQGAQRALERAGRRQDGLPRRRHPRPPGRDRRRGGAAQRQRPEDEERRLPRGPVTDKDTADPTTPSQAQANERSPPMQRKQTEPTLGHVPVTSATHADQPDRPLQHVQRLLRRSSRRARTAGSPAGPSRPPRSTRPARSTSSRRSWAATCSTARTSGSSPRPV